MAGKAAWERNFKGVKITLIVLYALSLVGSFYITAISGVGLLTISNTTPKDSEAEYQQELHSLYFSISNKIKSSVIFLFTETVFILGLIIGLLSIVSSTIALIGVVNENQCIMITLTVLGAIGVLGHFAVGNLSTGMLSLLVTILTGVYAYMIGEKKQAGSSSPA